MCLYEPGPVTNAYIKSNVANTIMKNSEVSVSAGVLSWPPMQLFSLDLHTGGVWFA